MYTFKIKDREIGGNNPTYFIADIAANHDGDLNKAIDLIHSAAEVELMLQNSNIFKQIL